MADSEVQIANYALTMIAGTRINSLTEDSHQARTVNAIFPLVRDACLIEHEWNFAIERVNLGLLSDAPEFDFDYQFSLPNDCLRVVGTNLPKGSKYKIEGRNILCDSDTLKIRYIKQVTDVAKFSASFVKYFATRLAEEIAFPISSSRTLEADMYSKAEKIKMSGFGIDSVEGTVDQPQQDDWNSVRY